MGFTAVNMSAFEAAQLNKDPFPHVLIESLLNPALVQGIQDAFPDIDQGGSFPANSKNTRGALASLLAELESEELRAAIASKFALDLKKRATMITLRGFSRAKDGQIHTDSKSKLITVLIYLNPSWEAATGRLRLLYDGTNLSPYAAEIAPNFGSAVIFQVTDNCWHGYEAYTGTRRSIQLNYMVSEEQTFKHLLLHKISAWMKAFSKKFKSSHNDAY